MPEKLPTLEQISGINKDRDRDAEIVENEKKIAEISRVKLEALVGRAKWEISSAIGELRNNNSDKAKEILQKIESELIQSGL